MEYLANGWVIRYSSFRKPFVNAEQISLFDDQKENTEDISIPCKIKNWKTKKIMTFKECKEIR